MTICELDGCENEAAERVELMRQRLRTAHRLTSYELCSANVCPLHYLALDDGKEVALGGTRRTHWRLSSWCFSLTEAAVPAGR